MGFGEGRGGSELGFSLMSSKTVWFLGVTVWAPMVFFVLPSPASWKPSWPQREEGFSELYLPFPLPPSFLGDFVWSGGV